MAIWLVGLAIYLLAVFHRSSLAVAGLAASERFDISAAQLSTFVVLQLRSTPGCRFRWASSSTASAHAA